MRTALAFLAISTVVVSANPQKPAEAQDPTVKQVAPAPKPAAQPAARTTVTVLVTDRSGKPIADAVVKATGPAERDGTTDAEGTLVLRNVNAGTYRLRFEHKEFVTLERDITVQAGRPLKTQAALTAAPPPPPPPPAPKPEPEPAPPPPTPATFVAQPSSIDIPAFFEKNYIGNAASKTSSVGCTGTSTATLVQIRDPLAEHTHMDADEMIYVVAGEGTERLGGRELPLNPGTFSVIPRTMAHSLTRRSRTPLVMLSILTGPPCQNAR
jgi:mannose-6-phosphate isomerase-like protein (cupin superfamily)